MTYDLQSFEDIRPLNDDEIKGAIDFLLADEQFSRILNGFLPLMPRWARNAMFRAMFVGVKTPTQFQVRIMQGLVKLVMRRSTDGVTFDHQTIRGKDGRYTFVTNHRDIVLDSAFLCILLMDIHYPTTVEIAIGDNLLIHQWIRTLVRLNKSFIVQRNLPPRELLRASQVLSNYMHYVVNVKRDNIWIAQREGRSKDSTDHTQESVLKMLALGGEGSPVDRLLAMNIMPMTISYEYDPCDYLKAQEFQLKRDNPEWRKSQKDDFTNMATGINGYKGRVHYQTAPCINAWLEELRPLPKTELFAEVARRLDRELHRNYRLYPGNYVADDLLTGTPVNADHYTRRERVEFERYIQSRLDKIDIPNKDEAYLRERLLLMYANPLRNYNAAR